MSMDKPNEYEQAIEAYAQAVRDQHEAEAAAERAGAKAEQARQTRQALWRVVAGHRNAGHTKPGIYRLSLRHESYAVGLLIQEHGDYPELAPMFR